MKQLPAISTLGLLLTACTDPDSATKALKDAAITPTHVGGYSLLGCGNDDDYATKFEGINAQGRPVSDVVCSGYFGKGATVRFN
jgi:hypothetical protein